jgi:hypothetical protein
MGMDTWIVLAFPVLLFAGAGVIAYLSHRRVKAGKKARVGWMVAGLVGSTVVLATGVQLLLTSPEQAGRAEETAARLLAALARGDDGQARATMTRALAAREDLDAWRLHPEARWELAGRDTRQDAIRLFYLVQSGPADRQTLYLSFEERDGQLLVSRLERVYHVPREVMALGEALVAGAADGRDVGSSAPFEALDAGDVAALGERLRALRDRVDDRPVGAGKGKGAKLEPKIASFETNRIVSLGRTQLDPRMRLDYEVSTAGGGAPVTFQLRVVHRNGTWHATGLSL